MSIEGIVKNLQTGGGYSVMRENARELFVKSFLPKMASKRGLTSDGDMLRLSVFGRGYSVDTLSGTVTEDSGKEAGNLDALLIYDLIVYSDYGAIPSDRFTPMQNLSTMHNSRSYAGEGMFAPTERSWDSRTDALASACEALGGVISGKGDVSYKIPFFAGMSVICSFWRSDDEFPASLNLMFDENTTRFIHYETVWYAARVLIDRIDEIMDI